MFTTAVCVHGSITLDLRSQPTLSFSGEPRRGVPGSSQRSMGQQADNRRESQHEDRPKLLSLLPAVERQGCQCRRNFGNGGVQRNCHSRGPQCHDEAGAGAPGARGGLSRVCRWLVNTARTLRIVRERFVLPTQGSLSLRTSNGADVITSGRRCTTFGSYERCWPVGMDRHR